MSPDAKDPGRQLLGDICAPLEREVIAALGLDADARSHWTVAGARVSAEQVHDSQARWYRDNPACIDEGLRRHADRLATLGL